MIFDTTIFFIECRTGCSCCANENHYRGPFSTLEIAKERVETYHRFRILASQYASTGNYKIEEAKAHITSEGIIICSDGTWYACFRDNVTIDDDEERCHNKSTRK
jgi:hypothetical protein